MQRLLSELGCWAYRFRVVLLGSFLGFVGGRGEGGGVSGFLEVLPDLGVLRPIRLKVVRF